MREEIVCPMKVISVGLTKMKGRPPQSSLRKGNTPGFAYRLELQYTEYADSDPICHGLYVWSARPASRMRHKDKIFFRCAMEGFSAKRAVTADITVTTDEDYEYTESAQMQDGEWTWIPVPLGTQVKRVRCAVSCDGYAVSEVVQLKGCCR